MGTLAERSGIFEYFNLYGYFAANAGETTSPLMTGMWVRVPPVPSGAVAQMVEHVFP